jgi:hypothetical protein
MTGIRSKTDADSIGIRKACTRSYSDAVEDSKTQTEKNRPQNFDKTQAVKIRPQNAVHRKLAG